MTNVLYVVESAIVRVTKNTLPNAVENLLARGYTRIRAITYGLEIVEDAHTRALYNRLPKKHDEILDEFGGKRDLDILIREGRVIIRDGIVEKRPVRTNRPARRSKRKTP